MKPLHKFCLVNPDEKEKISSGGIVLPDNIDREKPIKGEVVEIGDEVTKIKIGQHILFKRYAPYEYTNDTDVKILFVEEQDVLAIL